MCVKILERWDGTSNPMILHALIIVAQFWLANQVKYYNRDIVNPLNYEDF
jgi:hypothetical protein